MMVDLNNLEIGEWYKSRNILIKPLNKREERFQTKYEGYFDGIVYKLLTIQVISHMNAVDVNIHDKWMSFDYINQLDTRRSFLYWEDAEWTIEYDDVFKVEGSIELRDALSSVFEFKNIRGNAV